MDLVILGTPCSISKCNYVGNTIDTCTLSSRMISQIMCQLSFRRSPSDGFFTIAPHPTRVTNFTGVSACDADSVLVEGMRISFFILPKQPCTARVFEERNHSQSGVGGATLRKPGKLKEKAERLFCRRSRQSSPWRHRSGSERGTGRDEGL